MTEVTTVRNTTWDELKVGDEASVERTASAQDFYLFAHVTGNINPANLPGNEGAQPLAPSMWIGSLISAVLGNRLPGPGTLYRVQNLAFHERVHLGEKLIASVRCSEKGDKPHAIFETRVTKENGSLVAEGIAEVEAPTETIVADARELPELILDEHDHFGKLVAVAAQLPPMPTAVICPDDRNALGGAVLSARKGLIVPVLIGDRVAIEKAALDLGVDISGYKLIEIENHSAAAAKAVELVHTGEVRAVMKGNIHSDELLAQVVKKDGGLRSSRRISHTFVMDVPTLDHLLFISDAAINIAPDLLTKVDITQNAIDLAIACGVKEPRVGVLSAVETVNVNIPSTLDAAVLSKMADRGQIRGGIVDGPLAMDNAIDMEAARTKGITSLVAGRAEILVVPNLEAGNMLAKELTFVARGEAAGLVLGAKAPVMLTSRADNDRARLASAALAQLYDYWRRNGKAFEPAEKAVADAAE
ncbi:MAG: bifunctional enoyl-CoA hydratase/phosphate acetyltransferase [Pseudochelatococcus sp.]|jgi:phosphotransacetylase/acyl dehydratase|uniref:bifunctional enoyl-CoA hydratase/phosphate acetyltransferase n=1 Tax=Pseudochelatococcus sp. TaxID=2020869 RepID=UPI003D9134DC